MPPRKPTLDTLGAIVRAQTPTSDELTAIFGPAQDALQRDAGQYGFECGIQTPSQDSHHG